MNMNSTTFCSNFSTASLEYNQCLTEAEADMMICPDPSLCSANQSGDNVGLAFGLTIGAGLATTIGAFLPFVPCIKQANTRFLAIGLALAAGVMIYVSFTEIWTKSKDNFCCVTPDHSDLAVTACFFGGIVVTIMLDLMVASLQRIECRCCLPSRWCTGVKARSSSFPCCRRGSPDGKMCLREDQTSISATNGSARLEKIPPNGFQSEPLVDTASCDSSRPPPPPSETSNATLSSNRAPPTVGGATTNPTVVTPTGHDQHDSVSHTQSISNGNGAPGITAEQQSQLTSETDSRHFGAVTTPDGGSVSMASTGASESTNNYGTASVNEIFSNSSLLRMNAIIPETESLSLAEGREQEGGSLSHISVQVEGVVKSEDDLRRRSISYKEMTSTSEDSSEEEPLGPKELKEVTEGLGKDTKKLHRMGILTGLALGIHNFPEGLATFVATLSEPRLGAALAVAIAIHNVPEGVCVALPVYYATGKKWKGFLWAFLSGVSEPLGALLGWLVLKEVFGPMVYGIAFGLITGMMVYISLKELLPTAYRFDSTHGKVVTVSLVIGMFIMAISLILFLY